MVQSGTHNWIPCICDRCGLAFTIDAPVIVLKPEPDNSNPERGPGSMKYQPCPRCGGMATGFGGGAVTIDGEQYWSNTTDLSRLRNIERQLRDERLTALEAADQLDALSPAFSSLSAWLRQNQHLSGWVAAVPALIALYFQLTDRGLSEDEVRDVVDAVVHAQGVQQPDGSLRSTVPGRNQPCWCGSDIKFKFCHGSPGGPAAGDAPAAVGQKDSPQDEPDESVGPGELGDRETELGE